MAYRAYSEKPYELEVVRGNITGAQRVIKYGNTNGSTIGTAYQDIWSRCGTGDLLYPTTATTASFVSDSGNDVIAGTGLYQIMVYGLDENLAPQQELISLTGTTPVVTTTLWWRIYRMQAYTNGTTIVENDIQNGLITATVDTKVIAEMPEDLTTTFMCAVTIPMGKKGYLKTFQMSSSNKESALIELLVRRSHTAPWVIMFDMVVTETIHQSIPLHPGGPLPGGCDIRWRAKQIGTAAVKPSVQFQIEIIDD